MPQHAEPDDGVAGGQIQAPDEAANSLVRIGDAAQFEKTAQVQRVEEHCRDPFHFGRGCKRQLFLLAWSLRLRVANQFVETDRDGLAQIH